MLGVCTDSSRKRGNPCRSSLVRRTPADTSRLPAGLITSAVWGWLLVATATLAAEDCLGPCALVAAKDGKTLYVACADARQVLWVALPGGQVIRRVDVPAEPTGVALTPDDSRLIVTCAAPRSRIVVLDPASGAATATIPAGHTALAPTLTPDGQRLYVCNRFNNDVSVIDLAAGKELVRVPVVREPVAAAVTPDGSAVLVANHLPLTRTDAAFLEQVTPFVTVIDTRTQTTASIPLPAGSNSLRGLCVSPDGQYAYVTHILSNFNLVPFRVDMGWVNMNVLTVLDIAQRRRVNTVGLDELYYGAGNPWGVACTADGKVVCVSHAGTHELSLLDTSILASTLGMMFMSPQVGAISADPRLGTGPWQRLELPGKGPRGLAIVGSQVYVAEYFSDALAVVDLQTAGAGPIRTIALGPPPQLTARRRGELLFHDATICYQHWQSCGSCHPDGRADGLNWDLLNDGLSNPKNTKSMLLAHQTPPAMAEGVRMSAEEAVRSGLEHILFATRPEEDAAAIDEYLKSLQPVPSPHLVEGRLSPAAERGQELFRSQRVNCCQCHPAPLYTDLKPHNVHSRASNDFSDRFDTPTLVEVWRTAPYLHDGRYTTIKDLLVEGRHGRSRSPADGLTAQELDDLVEFVLSL